jgi:hypothetical protein
MSPIPHRHDPSGTPPVKNLLHNKIVQKLGNTVQESLKHAE